MGGGRKSTFPVTKTTVWLCFLFLIIIETSSLSFSREKRDLRWTEFPPNNTSTDDLSIANNVRSPNIYCSKKDTSLFRLPLCCPCGYELVEKKCKMSNKTLKFPPVHDPVTLELTDIVVNNINFHFFVNTACAGRQFKLSPEENDDDEFFLLRNGSLYLPFFESMVEITDYCLVFEQNQCVVLMCSESEEEEDSINLIFPISLLISVPFLLVTFLIYTILPELNNKHGFTLRGYIGSLAVAYFVLAILQTSPPDNISTKACIIFAFIIHFSFLASFFWLNIMSFDIWWTFGGFRTLRGSKQQRDRKKFIIYSIYAWGSASFLTGTCLILDFSPIIPKNFIRPHFGEGSCWFNDNTARALYFYGPMGLIVLCNIFLFISTAIKIQKHRKDTAHHLNGSESKRHDDNKQWFNLYLKLFIVMGITWSMEIVSWLLSTVKTPQYLWYITDLANTLQGVIIFIIFVCKKKIKRLLLKKFRRQNKKILSRNSTRSICHSSASRTCTTSISGIPLQEKASTNIRSEPICSSRESAEESDCA